MPFLRRKVLVARLRRPCKILPGAVSRYWRCYRKQPGSGLAAHLEVDQALLDRVCPLSSLERDKLADGSVPRQVKRRLHHVLPVPLGGQDQRQRRPPGGEARPVQRWPDCGPHLQKDPGQVTREQSSPPISLREADKPQQV